MSSLIELCWIVLPMKATSHLWGVNTVPPKWRLIKCSSMMSGVFPFTLNSPVWGVEGISCIPTQIVAQCMNCYPWTAAVTPCGWNLHALPADPRGVKLTKSNSWWHVFRFFSSVSTASIHNIGSAFYSSYTWLFTCLFRFLSHPKTKFPVFFKGKAVNLNRNSKLNQSERKSGPFCVNSNRKYLTFTY